MFFKQLICKCCTKKELQHLTFLSLFSTASRGKALKIKKEKISKKLVKFERTDILTVVTGINFELKL